MQSIISYVISTFQTFQKSNAFGGKILVIPGDSDVMAWMSKFLFGEVAFSMGLIS